MAFIRHLTGADDETYDVFYRLAKGAKSATVELPTPAPTVRQCVSCYNVFADPTDTDFYKNDISPVLFNFSQLSTVNMYLQYGESFTSEVAITDNTLGTFYTLGFIVDTRGNNYIGFAASWQKILNAYGEGMYRIRVAETYMGGTDSVYSDQYCLRKFSADRVNGTVRLEATISNVLGDIFNKNSGTLIDFGAGWYQQIRLPGWFGKDTSTYVKEIVEYKQTMQRKYWKMEQEEHFTLELKLLPSELHMYIKTYYIQADELMITDYNKNNPFSHVQEKVLIDGDYTPTYEKFSKLSWVQVKFKCAINSLRKRQ